MRKRTEYDDLWKAQQAKAGLISKRPQHEYTITQQPNGKFVVKRKRKPSYSHPWRS